MALTQNGGNAEGVDGILRVVKGTSERSYGGSVSCDKTLNGTGSDSAFLRFMAVAALRLDLGRSHINIRNGAFIWKE